MGARRKTLAEKFSDKYKVEENGCWIWIGCVIGLGYGMVFHEKQRLYAHRVAWTLHRGEIPYGKSVVLDKSKCTNSDCVNPAHHMLRDRTEMMADKAFNSRRVRGEQTHNAVLTDADVYAIRADSRVMHVIAYEYGVMQPTIASVKLRKTWKHLPIREDDTRFHMNGDKK